MGSTPPPTRAETGSGKQGRGRERRDAGGIEATGREHDTRGRGGTTVVHTPGRGTQRKEGPNESVHDAPVRGVHDGGHTCQTGLH